MNRSSLIVLLTLLLSVSCYGLDGYQEIRNAQDVIDRWDEDVHLYVKGDLGVGTRQYQQLESWLDEVGPHWTVVLMDSAEKEYYRAPDGREFRGMDAVEHALGHGLANQTDFGNLTNPNLGEQDGTVFVLFLKERKFSYYSSDAQDRRGLGQSRWIGFLDRPAIRAMRGGGRIIDAVKNTVSSVNSSLDRVIKQEVADAARLQRAREQAVEQAQTDIELARQSIREIGEAAQAVKAQLPEATGVLVAPPSDKWQQRLDGLEDALTEDNAVETSQEVEQLSAEMERYQLAYAERRALTDRLAPIEEAARELLTAENGVARAEAEQTLQLVSHTEEAASKGEIEFTDQFLETKQSLAAATAKVEAARVERERLARRRTLVRRTIFTTLAFVAALVVALLIYLNRRRVKLMQEAVSAYRKREASVNREMDRVLGLFERANEVLGPKEEIARRGYEGTTKRRTDDAFTGIDALLIMSGEVQRVMDEARDLVYPRDLIGKIANFFSGARYARSLNHISGEPLSFRRSDGLPLVLEAMQEGDREADVTAPPDEARERQEVPEIMRRTFEQVFNAFHDRCDFTAETLDVIENSLLRVSDKLNELQTEIDRLSVTEQELQQATEQDGFFDVPEFFDALIPSAQSDLDTADDIGAEDPVRAMHEFIPAGFRKVNEANLLAGTIKRARTEVFPTLNEHAPRLKSLGYETTWIPETIFELGVLANSLFQRACTTSVLDGAYQFGDDVTALADRSRECADLATHLAEDEGPAIEQLTRKVQQARATIAKELQLEPAVCLHEPRANPDDSLASARNQHEAAKAALQLGSMDAATEAVTALNVDLEEGNRVTDESLGVLRDFRAALAAKRQDHQVATDKMPATRQLLERARDDYASTALLLRAGDPSYPDNAASTESHWRDCEHALQQAGDLLEQAQPRYAEARLLAAANLLEQADAETIGANRLMDEIEMHHRRLEQQTVANSELLGELSGRLGAIDSAVQDDRTTRETIQAFARFEDALGQTAGHVGTQHRDRDPFENAESLATHQQRFRELESMIEADRDAYEEARRAVRGAEAELQKAKRLVQQAARDEIPDSPKTKRCMASISALEREVKVVAAHLGVAHGNWQEVDAEAARINADLGVQSDELQGELQLAAESLRLFQRASRDVFNATNWTGRYGIRVTGAPGASELERARAALRAGDYSALVQLARAAKTEAEYAIDRAQRKVARRRREEQRREEERRRRRRRSSVSVGSSGGGFRGGGGFGGGGSSGNSGFSRSGW